MEGEEEFDPKGAANAELRYITLELMKIAQKSGKGFREVAEEYLDNASMLSDMITGEQEGEASPSKKATYTRER